MRNLLILSGVVFALGCTDAKPTTTLSVANFKAPTVSYSGTITIAQAIDIVTVSGQCDQLTKRLQWSLKSPVAWQTAVAGTDLNCADGTFSFTIDPVASGFSASLNPTGIDFVLQAESMIGEMSGIAGFRIRLSSGLKNELATVSAGGGIMKSKSSSGPQYKIIGRIGTIKTESTMLDQADPVNGDRIKTQ